MLCEIEKERIVAVFAIGVCVTLDDDGLRIVEENVRWDAAEKCEGAFETSNERIGPLIVGESDESISRIPELCGECA